MIVHLTGKILDIGEDRFVLDVGGVGYGLIAPASTLVRLPPIGGTVSVHTHLVVREDSLSLYGFLTRAEVRLFSRMLEVAGVGPRVAVAVLSSVSPEDFERAILFEDSDWLTSIPGVGRKLAGRLVMELKDQFEQKKRSRVRRVSAPASAGPVAEAVEALGALGYSRTEAGEAVARVTADDMPATAEDIVHRCLKILGKRD